MYCGYFECLASIWIYGEAVGCMWLGSSDTEYQFNVIIHSSRRTHMVGRIQASLNHGTIVILILLFRSEVSFKIYPKCLSSMFLCFDRMYAQNYSTNNTKGGGNGYTGYISVGLGTVTVSVVLYSLMYMYLN